VASAPVVHKDSSHDATTAHKRRAALDAEPRGGGTSTSGLVQEARGADATIAGPCGWWVTRSRWFHSSVAAVREEMLYERLSPNTVSRMADSRLT